jgi:hypothetical protein
MPRKKRHAKRRSALPTNLAAISLCERARWRSSGPILESDQIEVTSADFDRVYHVWPSWSTWFAFYQSVRDELFAARPHLRDTSIAEGIYEAIVEGADPDETRARLLAAREDPRRLLCRAN